MRVVLDQPSTNYGSGGQLPAYSAAAMQQQMDDLQRAITQLQECMTSWGVASYVPCTMPALRVLSAALQEDRRRLGTFHAFLQRNGQELNCAGQGYFSVLPHEVVLSILSHLAPKDLLCVALVNAFFASMCSDGFVWSAVYDRIWPLSLCFTSPWHRHSLTPPTPSPPALQSPASTSCTSTADHQSGRSSDTVGGDDPARLRDSGVSWKRVVQQRAQTERNWEEGTYRVVHEFSATAPLSDMAMNRCRPSRARVMVAFSTYSNKALLYDLNSGEKLQEVGLDDTGPMGLTFMDDSTLITCGHRDGGLQLWDVEMGKCIQSCEEADANGVAPFEGTECGNTDLSHLFVSLTAKKVEVYDTRSLSRVMSLRGHRQLLVCAAARSSKGGRIASGDMDGTVMYWDLRTQKSLGSAAYQDMRSRVHSVGIDPRRDVVVSSSGMGHLLLWDIDGYRASPIPTLQVGRVVDKVRTTVGSFRAFHTSMDAIAAVQFRGLDHFVTAQAGGRVGVWNTKMLLDGTATNRQYVCSQEPAEAWNEVKFMVCDDERVVTGLTCGIVRVLSYYPSA